jgi:hypothetical protein
MKPLLRWLVTVMAAFFLMSPIWAETPAPAAEGGDKATDLAKKLNNPISDLVSVPFQANWNAGVGPEDGTQFLLNIQPVVPSTLNKDWNLITRVIVPVLGQPALTPGGPSSFGMSDILASVFFSPSGSKKVIWGVGPVLSLPTSSEPTLGSRQWSAGPTFVILKQSGPWTYGALWNQIWSFAEASDTNPPSVSQMYTQPFLAYTTKKALTFNVSSETITNWEAPSGEEWTIPIIFQVSKLSWFGPFPASFGVGIGDYLDSPDGGPSWKLRANFTLILPRKK